MLRRGDEPSYRDRKLSFWLAQGPAGFDEGADEFLRNNSAVVTRYLISSLCRQDNPFWKPYQRLQKRVPVFIAKQMPVWMEPKLVRAGATYWLAQLGPQAAAAVPTLRQRGSQDTCAEVRCGALWSLGRIDSSKESVTVMLTALRRDKDVKARRAAAGALEVWAPDDPEVISTLIGSLTDSDAVVAQISAAALGKYGSRASGALPSLKRLAAGDSAAADYAAWAIKQIQKVSHLPLPD